MLARRLGSFQEVTISNFFGETNLESPFQHQVVIKKKPRKKDLSKSDNNCGDIQISFMNKNHLQ